MKTDIVERLNLRDASCSYVENIYKDAAAEILRLRADNEKLRANFTVLADAVRAAKEEASYNRHKNEHCISRILSLRADNEKLREETRSKGERIGGYVNMLVKREAEIEKLREALKLLMTDYVEGWTQDQYSEEDAMQFDAYIAAAAALKETGD